MKVEIDTNKIENKYSLFGFIGCILLCIGVFVPIINLPLLGLTKDFFDNGKGDGIIILISAAISFYLVISKRLKGLWITGLASLGISLFTFVKILRMLSQTRSEMYSGAHGAFERGMVEAISSSVHLGWAWILLFPGSVLLILAAKGDTPLNEITTDLEDLVKSIVKTMGGKIEGIIESLAVEVNKLISNSSAAWLKLRKTIFISSIVATGIFILIVAVLFVIQQINISKSKDWFRKAYNLETAEKYKEAAEAYNKCLKLNPKYSNAWLNLGNIYYRLEIDNQAFKSYNKAIETNPKNSIAYNVRGQLYELTGSPPYAALEDFNKAIELDPKSGVVYFNRSRWYEKHESTNKDQILKDMKESARLGFKEAQDTLKNYGVE